MSVPLPPDAPIEPASNDATEAGTSVGRRQFVGAAAATAVGAAVVWNTQFPFAGASIGQALDPGTGPTGPTGTSQSTTTTTSTVPSGAAPASTGTTGTGGALATTGTPTTAFGLLGTGAIVAGSGIVWLRRRSDASGQPG